MTNLLRSAVLILVLSLLGSCTPGSAIRGSSSYKPINLLEVSELNLTPGSKWYFVAHELSPDYFGIDNFDLPDEAFESSVGDSFSNRIFGEFEVVSAGLPPAMTPKITNVYVNQTITDLIKNGRQVSVRWRETVNIVFELDVPANTYPQEHIMTLFVKAKNGNTHPIIIPVKIEAITNI